MKCRFFKWKGAPKGRDILWWVPIFCLLFGGTLISGVVFAQEKYPSRPINFLIGFPAGGTTDVCARPLVKLNEEMGGLIQRLGLREK